MVVLFPILVWAESVHLPPFPALLQSIQQQLALAFLIITKGPPPPADAVTNYQNLKLLNLPASMLSNLLKMHA
jgi:hypothetical protein